VSVRFGGFASMDRRVVRRAADSKQINCTTRDNWDYRA
jgi:hypothetical protein